jgi:hypothetical protein
VLSEKNLKFVMAVPEVEPQPDMTDTVEKSQNKTEMMEEEEVRVFIYRRPTLYPLEIAVDFFKSP